MSDLPSSDALIGLRLGSCRIERRLSAGGMSAIYLAQQERPRRSVAVKVLRPQLLADPRQWPLFLARFRREADATASLDHANIVPIYEFGEQDDLAYLVMPYLPDGSLATLLAREGPLPIPQALSYVDQIASALDYAHQHGIVHRDVKPSNLLLHPDGRLVLADFGIARPLDQSDLPKISLASDARDDSALTVGGVTLGTPDYMAPEQIRGERVGPPADIYALGVVTYAMLSGRAPFGGGPTAQVLARQLNEAPPPLRLARPDASTRMEEVIFWALAKDATERPPTAGAFAQAMRDGARGLLGALWKRAAATGTSLSSYRTGGEALAAAPAALGGFAASPDATLFDPAYHTPDSNRIWSPQSATGGAGGGAGGGAAGVAWPGARPRGGGMLPQRRGIPAALVAAVCLALAVLVVMAVIVGNALGAGGLGALGGPSGQTGALGRPTATVTATPSPSPTATLPPNWLSADPTTLSLGCTKKNKTLYVHLTNSGDTHIDWIVQLPDNPGIKVSPQSGGLDAGKTVTITVNNTSTVFNGGPANDQFSFVPNDSDAGDPAVVTYSTQACVFGG
ncbi:MAG TPA: protein kinase [Ktedonobacterales bacterium]